MYMCISLVCVEPPSPSRVIDFRFFSRDFRGIFGLRGGEGEVTCSHPPRVLSMVHVWALRLGKCALRFSSAMPVEKAEPDPEVKALAEEFAVPRPISTPPAPASAC